MSKNVFFRKPRMVGLLFSRPEFKFAKEHILAHWSHYHERSGNSFDFFCVGYRHQVWDSNGLPVTHEFSTEAFNEIVAEIESNTNWKPSGENDLLLLDASYDAASNKASLDFSNCIKLNLDELVRGKAIASVPAFFEQIFQFFKCYNGDNPTWKFSNVMLGNSTVNSIKKLILLLAPEKIRDEVEKVANFAVKNISK